MEGAACVVVAVRWVSVEAVARPSFEAGAKSGPRLGSSVACATVLLDVVAGGGEFDAHAASASEPIKNIPRCLMGLFLSCFSARAYGLRLNTLRRSESGISNKQTNQSFGSSLDISGSFPHFHA